MVPVAMSSGTIMGAFLLSVIVLGYLVIWGLWRFVFRDAPADGADAARVRPDDRLDL